MFCRRNTNCMLQYKILNNILFLSKLLFKFKKVPSPLCSFCKPGDETLLHIFYTCNVTKRLWNKIQHFVAQNLYILKITPQITFFRFFDICNQIQNLLLINYLLLIFKHCLYTAGGNGSVCFTNLKLYLIKS